MQETIRVGPNQDRVAALIRMGERAKERGDLHSARRMFHTAMRESLSSKDGKENMISIATSLASIYFVATNYDKAEAWYKRALDLSIMAHGEHSAQVASLLLKIAELAVTGGRINEHQALFERVQRVYLMCDALDFNALIISLVDLSWALCVANQASAAQQVNSFIAQVKQAEIIDPEPVYEQNSETLCN